MECLGVVIETLEVDEILIDSVKSLLLRRSREENSSISSLNSVLHYWWLVVWRTVYFINRADAESSK